ncbi:MAG: DUF1801 domain-containing protein [Kibdelosporangium sp.]
MPKFTSVPDYVDSLPAAQREIAGTLLPLIADVLPGTDGIWHGHPVWSLGPAPGKSPVCLIKAYSAHVTFAFWKGQAIKDPSGRLQPAANEMAGVKLRSTADIDPDLFTDWLKQARTLEA